MVNAASLWEMSIKASMGRLELTGSISEIVREGLEPHDIQLLTVSPAHLDELRNLPHHHRDPFDRLLIAQAFVEGAHLVSWDGAFDAYGVAWVWEQ